MVKNLKMIRFRVIFTGLFLLLNKVCLANTAQFKITPYYESYYGFNTDFKTGMPDKIFFLPNGGMRVDCSAAMLKADGSEEVLKVFWARTDVNNHVKLTNDPADGIWDAGNNTLIIPPSETTADLEGKRYACGTLDNGQYQQYSTPQVMVQSFLREFPNQLGDKNLTREEFGNAYIQCAVPGGVPEPAVSWSHNGSILATAGSTKYKIISSSALQITKLTFIDAGDYRCLAMNSAGVQESPKTTILVEMLNKALSFTRTPDNTTASTGENVTLTCRFNKIPTSYNWKYKTMEDKAGEESVAEKLKRGKWVKLPLGDLLITSVDRNDSGKYTCVGQDDSNGIYSRVEVNVEYFDKTVTKDPQNQEATMGRQVTISCTVPLANPALNISMYHNSAEITAKPGITIRQVENTYSVIIESVEMRDAGPYSCLGYSNKDTWGGDQGILTVREDGIKPHGYLDKRTYDVNVTKDAVLTCSALADPRPEVEWFQQAGKTITRLNATDRLQFNTSEPVDNRYNFTLTIKKITLNDHEEKYFCRLNNKLGTTESSKMTILVNHISCQNNKEHQTKYFNVQEPAQVACPQSLSAHPKEYISWSYNNSESSLRLKENGVTLYTDSLTPEDAGIYKCVANNTMGSCDYVIEIEPQDLRAKASENNKTVMVVVAGFAVIIVLLVVMFVAILQIRKRAKKKKIESTEAQELLNQPAFTATVNGYEDGPSSVLLPNSPTGGFSNVPLNPLYGTLSKFAKWQVARTRLSNLSILGEGQFGNVYKAELKSLDGTPSIFVAIKQIKDDHNAEAILEYEKEMIMMTQLHHPNIVQLVGLCTDSPPYYILTEYMSQGSLSNFLQDIAQSKSEMLELWEQIHICAQIASGLKYMAHKEFVHRDVAARNCLVGPNLMVKVADFGLSRSVRGREIYHKDGGTVPIRWMSPEAIQYGQYTTANDMWAYGVTMWEVFSYGVIPYSAWSNEDVAVNVQAGSRLIRPDGCPPSVYNVMGHCWAEFPDHRPTFVQILDSINAIVT